MRTRLHRYVRAFALTVVLMGSNSWAGEKSAAAGSISQQALVLAESKNYSAALKMISDQPEAVKSSYPVRFAEARILAWSGQYLKSGLAYRSLRNDFPDDADIRVGQGYLEYFRGNLRDAEQSFQSVLQRHPEYQDAVTGLRAVERAKRDNTPWKLDTGLSWSTFENSNKSDWTEQFFRIERRFEKVAFAGQVNHYNRFDLTDTSYQFSLASRQTKTWDWSLAAGITPNADFRPKIFGNANAGYSFRTSSNMTIRPGLSYRVDSYDADTIHTLASDLGLTLDNGLNFIARAISVYQSDEKDLYGWLVRGWAPLNDTFSVHLGAAQAPETINGDAMQTDSLFGGLRWNLGTYTALNLNLSRDDRDNSEIRKSYNVWLSHNF